MKTKLLFLVLTFYSSLAMSQFSDWVNYNNGYIVKCSVREADTMWIGTNGGGLVKYVVTTGSKTFYNKANSGLVQNLVTSIAIDGLGNKWINYWGNGNPSGLTKFDGTNWTTYNTSNSNIYSNNLYGNIVVDNSNNVWIMSYSNNALDMAIMMFDGNSFSCYVGLNYYASWACKDSTGNIWFGGDGKIMKYDGFSFTDYNAPLIVLDGRVSSIAADGVGNIWVGFTGYDHPLLPIHYKGGIAKFNGVSWTEYDIIALGAPTDYLDYLTCDHSNKVLCLISSYPISQQKIGVFDGTTFSSTYSINNDSIDAPSSIYVDDFNNKWIGGTFHGLYLQDVSNNWTNINTSASTLLDNTGIDIEPDLSGNIWVITRDSGIAMFNKTTWVAFNETTTGIIGINDCKHVVVDHQNRKWFSSNIGLIMYDNSTWTIIDTSNSNIPGNSIVGVAIDTSGNLWFTCYLNNTTIIGKYDGSTFQTFNDSTAGINLGYISCISINSQSVKYFGTNKGIITFDDSTWTFYTNINSVLPSHATYNNIAFDSNDNAFTGTYFGWGLFKFDGSVWTNYFPSFAVSAVIADSLNFIWFAYHGALYKFDQSTNNVVDSFTTLNSGLPGATNTDCLTFDKFNNLWVATQTFGVAGYKQGGIIATGLENINVSKTESLSIQAIPNPSSEFTSIYFDMPYRTNINISIFDILGNLQSTVKNNFSYYGKNSISIKTANLPAGIYLVRLETYKESKTIKLIVSNH